MDKINIFNNVDKDSIINFLRCEIRVVNLKWMRISVIVNIIALMASIYFAENQLIVIVICILLGSVIGLSYVYFIKKTEQNKQNLYFFHGIYTGLWDISLGILAYTLLKYGDGKNHYCVLAIMIIGSIFIVCITTLLYVKKIKVDYYKNYEMKNSVITMPAMGAFLLAIRPLYTVIGRIYIIAMAFVIIGMLSVVNMVYFLLKSYGYSLVDEKEVRAQMVKLRVKNASFSKFGKK